jgi:hypothetical protein
MAVYVDDAFVSDSPTAWGRWTGGGHLMADTLDELHAFAQSIGLRREWFQTRPSRPEKDHYDLTRARRDAAILAGAIPESIADGAARRRAIRQARREAA